MADWGGLAKKYGTDQNTPDELKKNKLPPTEHQDLLSNVDAIDNAKREVLNATTLADKVKATFKDQDGFAGGSVGDCVSETLGDCAQDLGLGHKQEATKSISIGMGGSSSSEEEE